MRRHAVKSNCTSRASISQSVARITSRLSLSQENYRELMRRVEDLLNYGVLGVVVADNRRVHDVVQTVHGVA
jgi:hypothetical protein